MSRIGKLPVQFASDINVSANGNVITFAKGKNSVDLDTKGNVAFNVDGDVLTFSTLSDSREHRAFWGTYRALAANIVTGLTTGYTRALEINGVGYRASVNGSVLNLQLGFSHDINYQLPAGIEATVEKNVITLKSHDKQSLGQVAAEVRGFRPPEPYKGKGVKYAEETIVRKAGKTSKK
ncbi:MAG: 50S ribosomal protein L6 [Sulfurimonas sp. RIFOXYD12_FULL_33_39]|uniref:50S ribosomal protein L6 n=1 Tax=unclassified Sulfurimonas TaxID=2623549 RepID=UPI0008C7377E|nr:MULTISPECIES: 50S ribosomal protein L6 [unclassified Sulfurimonas]OHE07275.1 MAG: 50S ribosomal protein L6 [Sulfurimonas sp. RIFCSPLOWO2_12_FULL_34_6]OHE10376.1 MAG: 50S ribosomal protein L6 [Sulfurimonas sp. RIFOXYD12_FULL_33_39]OHE14508.1 MAG: 50S ribosomal protein L6 [Sulfurimonas sp. RIFOXYD2_FULL_34_21]